MNQDNKTVYLAFINHNLPRSWEKLTDDLSSSLPFIFSHVEINIDLILFYSEERNQYHSTLILSKILKHLPENGEKIIGITTVDIFIPILTFLFGEAQLGGIGAIVSTYRLHNEFYGLPKDDSLLYTRVLKEVMHEFGHLMGLVHCRDYECVMHSSTYVEDIDLKKAQYCVACHNISKI